MELEVITQHYETIYDALVTYHGNLTLEKVGLNLPRCIYNISPCRGTQQTA
jgi:hypothetical protein